MISEITLQSAELVAAIHALGREAYAVEAGLIGCADIPRCVAGSVPDFSRGDR